MSARNYQIRFARPSVGEDGAPLSGRLTDLHARHGEHLPAQDLSGDRYQVRDLLKVGQVWRGTFGKLRDDAPHLVNSANEEMELELDEGDRLLEKCHFLYRERTNLLVWQLNLSSGGMSRFQEYLSHLLGTPALVSVVMNTGQLEEVLNRSVYEISYGYDKPPTLDSRTPKWNQGQFDLMKQIDAGHGKFEFRADRGKSLSAKAKAMIRQALRLNGVEKVRVRLTDHADPIELFSAPLKDRITVQRLGMYPAAADVFQELEAAYDRNRAAIASENANP